MLGLTFSLTEESRDFPVGPPISTSATSASRAFKLLIQLNSLCTFPARKTTRCTQNPLDCSVVVTRKFSGSYKLLLLIRRCEGKDNSPLLRLANICICGKTDESFFRSNCRSRGSVDHTHTWRRAAAAEVKRPCVEGVAA